MDVSIIKERNIFLSILLTFLTCGIYGLYWFFSIVYDIYTLDGGYDNFALDVLFSVLTCGLYTFYVLYKTAIKLNNIKSKVYTNYSETSIALLIILQIFSFTIINCCILQDELNNLKSRKFDVLDI